MSIRAFASRRVLQRVLLCLGVGALLGIANLLWNLGIPFLVALCASAAIFPAALGMARLPVALAIWAGQYLVFWLRVVAPTKSVDPMSGMLYLINAMAIFMPAFAVLTGAYIGIVLDRNRRAAHPPQT